MGCSKHLFTLTLLVGAVTAVAGSVLPPSVATGAESSVTNSSAFFRFAHCYDYLTEDHYNDTLFNRNGIVPEMYRWPWGIIPYIVEDHVDTNTRQILKEGINLIQASTCLRFIPRTTEMTYITIRTSEGNACFCRGIGMRGGPQVVNLGVPGCSLASTAAHELLHAAGLHHEHARPDRDQYVRINWDNLHKSHFHDYKRCDEGPSPAQNDGCSAFGEAYNVASIMHYPGLVPDPAFAIDVNIPIMESIPPTPPIPNGDNDKITKEDAAKINKMYKQCQ